jgi:hypothetical protein
LNRQKRFRIIRYLILTLVALPFLHRIVDFLPESFEIPLRKGLWVLGGFCIILLGLFLGVQMIQNFHYERAFVPKKLRLPIPPTLADFQIMNPLERPGSYHKAQLHVHTNRSFDSHTSPEEVIASYVRDGYHFVAITDHDRYSDMSYLSRPDCLVVPGIEVTIPALFWPIPLGKHLVVLNPPPNLSPWLKPQDWIDRVDQSGGVVIPAHLNWRGGAGTGRWFPDKLLILKKLRLVEINNPHSDDPIDFVIWHKLILKAGPEAPVWGVAVDDSHSGSCRKGWIMVKTETIEGQAFIAALKAGAFYATTGPMMEIAVTGREIRVNTANGAWIRFLNAQNQAVGVFRSDEAVYACHGDEGFVRVEVTNPSGIAWSQPFWLVKI